jgi:hypothetical protein
MTMDWKITSVVAIKITRHHTMLLLVQQQQKKNTGAATERDDFQTAVSMNLVEYKKTQKNYGVSSVKCHLMNAFYFLKITFSKWSFWRAVHSCNCDRKLPITSQQTFISGSNFDPDVPFRPLT